MEKIKKSPFLKFNEDQLSDVRKAVGYEDVNKLKEDIEHLKDWIKKQEHFRVKVIDDAYLERLLIYNKGSVERTKNKFDKFCRCTTTMPEFLQNFDIKNEFLPVHSVVHTIILPEPTKDNYRLFILTLSGQMNNEFTLMKLVRHCIVLLHYTMNNDYCHGLEAVIDNRNLSFGLMSKISPFVIKKAVAIAIDSMGHRIKKMHLISDSKLFSILFGILKITLPEKIKRKIEIHPNMKQLHEHVPKEILPSDFGGDNRSVKEIHDLQFKEFCSSKHIAKVKFMQTVGIYLDQ